MRLRLLDLDGSLPTQPGLRALLERGLAQRLHLRELGPELRLWAPERAIARLRECLSQAEAPPGCGSTLTLFGSGDFHNLTPLLLENLREPVSLIHFDNHPDWVRWAPRRHCGAWVNRALELPLVRKVITLGPCSDDLHRPHWKGGNLSALRDGRLETYPWLRTPTRVPRDFASTPAYRVIDHRLHWRNLADCEPERFVDELVERLPTRALWISIDKDVLRTEDAATNWDQGSMPLDFLLRSLRRLGHHCRIVGADICGDYAPPDHRHWLKRIEAWRDQPRAAPTELWRNDYSNRQLLGCLRPLLA